MRFHCLFEQSGTFKNVFKKYGHQAFDYDVLNDYKQTDYIIDLFNEIELEFDNLVNNKSNITIFSNMQPDKDFIIAFFPCTYFCDANQLQFRLLIAGKKLEFNNQAVVRLLNRNNERSRYFNLYLKLCFICKEKGIKTIIENPASGGKNNYLACYSPIPVAWHEKDRSLFGDDLKKPTNYFAINFDMQENFIMFDKNIFKQRVLKLRSRARSELSSAYADNFYKRFIQNVVC